MIVDTTPLEAGKLAESSGFFSQWRSQESHSIGGYSVPVYMTGVMIHGNVFDMLYLGCSIEVESCC